MGVGDFSRIGMNVAAITAVNDSIRSIGSLQARLAAKEDTMPADITITESALDDDLVQEHLEVTKLQILQQTALIMLTQANAAPQRVLPLLQ